MKIEHFAFNVESPRVIADWYVNHLKMEIVRQSENEPYMTFLADDSGRVMIEIYNNPSDEVPDYRKMNPLIMHLAFVSEQPDVEKKRLEKAGASLVSEDHLDDGSHIIMMRDPWGFPIQLCKRGAPMLARRES
ncbi:MAG: VOC family protein [Balneolaceae bacterium]